MKPSFNIPLHCFWAKLNHRTRGQCDLSIWFCLCFAFVRSHAQCGCFSIVFWRGWSFHLKLDVQGQGDKKVSDVNRKVCVWVGFLKIMDDICVLSLLVLNTGLFNIILSAIWSTLKLSTNYGELIYQKLQKVQVLGRVSLFLFLVITKFALLFLKLINSNKMFDRSNFIQILMEKAMMIFILAES